MMYAKIENGSISTYPYGLVSLRRDNPNTSFPLDSLEREDIRNEYGISEVISTERPSRKGWNAVEEAPSFGGGVWTQNWKLVPKEVNNLHPFDDVESVDTPVQEGFTAKEGTPELVGEVWKQTWTLEENTWLQNRLDAYGTAESQVEFITENGLEAWQTKVAEIKAKYPKS